MTNPAEYDAALRRWGSLTVWFTDAAIAAWRAVPRSTPGGQASYSDHAITTALMLRGVPVGVAPDRGADRLDPATAQPGSAGARARQGQRSYHTTLGRRARTLDLPVRHPAGGAIHLLVDSTGLKLCGPGEWLIEKHGTRRWRSWRKRHIGMEAASGQIVAAALTDRAVDDVAQVGPPLDQVADPIAALLGDGAYACLGVYADMQARHPEAAVVVPPRVNAVLSDTAETAPTQRDRPLQRIAKTGRLNWQRDS